jgi:predicted MPP superfamily phosphohydrolase
VRPLRPARDEAGNDTSTRAKRRGHRKARRGGLASLVHRITWLTHAPVALAWGELLRRAHVPWPWLVGALAAGLATLPAEQRVRTLMSDWPRPTWHTALDELYFVHWCGAFGSAPFLVLTVIIGLVASALRGALAFPGGAVAVVYLVVLAIAAYGILVRRRWTRTLRLDIAIEGLPRAFDGYRIAHLSDLHIGSLTPRSAGERWVSRSNAEAPDAVVVTGDLVTSGTMFHNDIAGLLANLRAPDGVFVAMGNHDYFGEGDPLIVLMRDRGLRVLRNDAANIERGEARLRIAAVDDTWTGRADLDRALAGGEGGAPTVLLAHDPTLFPRAAALGAELVLSGHTHGGQVALPFFARWVNLARISYKHTYGLYREGASTLFVHGGLGVTGPPIRLGVPPEVAIITLRQGNASRDGTPRRG